ncbi:MAG: hypothetical protein ACF8AM_10285 [Rhodopirellula sp. JB055]|uniref:hypothetical protein n=1 Tax=Rhodopirellula sp. JB055 TaxID=3342846 RepID=UPI003709CC5B
METQKPEGAPDVMEFAAWRPFFTTDAGVVTGSDMIGSGFAFQMREDSKPVFVTAFHLLGTAGGLERDLHPGDLSDSVETTFLSDVFGATDGVKQIGAPYQPCDQDTAQEFVDTDVVAFDLVGRFKPTMLELSNHPIQLGQRLWMVTAVFAGASPSQKCHAVKVLDVKGGKIRYRFENDRLSLKATDGAPLLFDSGKVAGMHQGGSTDDEGVFGQGVSSEALRQAIDSMCLEE